MMFRFLENKTAFWLSRKQVRRSAAGGDHSGQDHGKGGSQDRLSSRLDDNLRSIRREVGRSSDVVIREFTFGRRRSIRAALVYVDGLSDIKIINRSIIEPLMVRSGILERGDDKESGFLNRVEAEVLSVSEVVRAGNLAAAMEGFLSGDVALLMDGVPKALIISCKGWDKRNVSEPASESVIRGPRESFTESVRTNTSLIRRKIKDPALTMEMMQLGRKTRTSVCIIYVRGLADRGLIRTVRQRLEAIDTDAILESGYIEQYIEDNPYSIFSTIHNSERPDVIAANLLEGRVAIAVDGTPFVLTVPYLFIQAFQTAEDYYFRPFFMSLLRMVRYLAYLITVTAPAIYVAMTTYHQELIPTDLLFTMASAREGIPFPAFLESLIMLLTFEILREAGVRLPRQVGQAMSIVGALVIGESAVSAGLIGAPMVIVIAITAVSVFVVPSQEDSAAVLRLLLLALSATMGAFGITIGLLGILVHMASLESFGVPFLSPLTPFRPAGNKDVFVRAPLWMMISRPDGMAQGNRKRQVIKVPRRNPQAGGRRGHPL